MLIVLLSWRGSSQRISRQGGIDSLNRQRSEFLLMRALCIPDTSHLQQWDLSRSTHSQNLDGILEILEAQLVPPAFYEQAESSQLFGDQHNQVDGDGDAGNSADRSKWKTLRDFVAERDIEEATENMDNDRIALDVCHQSFFPYPSFQAQRLRCRIFLQ